MKQSSLVARRVSLLAAVVLLVAAGCSSSDGDESPDGAAVPSEVTTAETVAPATLDELDSDERDSDDRERDDEGDVEQTCVELQVVQDFSTEIADATNGILSDVASSGGQGSEAETIAAFIGLAERIDELLPDLLAAYERAAAVAPPDIAVEIRAVADGTAVLTPPLVEAYGGIEKAEDLADLESVFNTAEMRDAATSAGIASLRLDNFTNPNCGFQFSNR